MMRAGAVAVTAVLLMAGPTAGFAALERVGSVVLTPVAPGQSEYRNFAGNEITLTARNADINCESVVATFDSGRSRGIFAGALPRGKEISVGLSASQGRVIRLDFNCRPANGLGGVIDIAGGTNQLFAERNAGQLAEEVPGRGGWRAFLSRLF